MALTFAIRTSSSGLCWSLVLRLPLDSVKAIPHTYILRSHTYVSCSGISVQVQNRWHMAYICFLICTLFDLRLHMEPCGPYLQPPRAPLSMQSVCQVAAAHHLPPPLHTRLAVSSKRLCARALILTPMTASLKLSFVLAAVDVASCIFHSDARPCEMSSVQPICVFGPTFRLTLPYQRQRSIIINKIKNNECQKTYY